MNGVAARKDHRVDPLRLETAADHAAGLIVHRHMHGDEIAGGKQLVERIFVPDALRELPRMLDGDHRVVTDDVHAQRDGRVGNQHADGAQADDAERFAAQLRADKRLFALFDGFFNAVALPLQAARPLDAADDVAAGEQHGRQHHFADGVGVRARRVEHADARLRACVDGDVVRARARARNAQHGGRKRHVMHGGRTDENRIRLPGAVADVVALGSTCLHICGNLYL